VGCEGDEEDCTSSFLWSSFVFGALLGFVAIVAFFVLPCEESMSQETKEATSKKRENEA